MVLALGWGTRGLWVQTSGQFLTTSLPQKIFPARHTIKIKKGPDRPKKKTDNHHQKEKAKSMFLCLIYQLLLLSQMW